MNLFGREDLFKKEFIVLLNLICEYNKYRLWYFFEF